MAYVSLYRKYRPQTFAEVVGQSHVTTTLSHAVTDDRLHHAYLFTGPRGTGKTSTARILAKSLNCETGPTATPCNACVHCTGITHGSSIDVIEIDAASHGGVDDVRDLRDRVAFAPASARMKVYIVDECHMLSTAGWNAFLKTVEEPPGHVVFVFATTEPHRVLDTILSRTQRFDFKRIAADDLGAYVGVLGEREGLTFEPGTIDLVVRAGDGSARDTLSVLDQVIAFSGKEITLGAVAEVLGAVPEELLFEAADHVASGDVAGLCVLVQRLADAGHDLRQFSRDAVEHLRTLFLLQVAPDAGLVDTTPERLQRLVGQSTRLGQVELLRAVELLAEAQAQMRRGNTRLPLEIALVKAALPDACGDEAALAARIDRLERRTGVDPGAGAVPSEAVAAVAAVEGGVAAAPAVAAPAAAVVETPAAVPAIDAPAPPAVDETAAAGETPAPTAGSDPEPASPAQASTVDLELVRRSWQAVLDAVKGRTRRLHAFLNEGQPIGYDDGELTLEFRSGYGFHAERCGDDQSQQVVGEVLQEVLGVRPRLRCRVADGDDRPPTVPGDASRQVDLAAEAESVAETEALEAAGELPDESEAHHRAIETLTRDLGATVLDDDAR